MICVAGFWVRVAGVGSMPAGQYTSTDAYLYDHQTRIVSSQGHLPGRDLRRWVPLGRDTHQSLNLYPIVLGYVHRVCVFFVPSVSVSVIVRLAPVVCFCLGIFLLCVFLAETEGFGISVGSAMILATLPGTIERSAYGFGDRDAFCWLIGISAVVTYLLALRIRDTRWRFFSTLLSGGVMFLGGMSWEGFGAFLGIVGSVEVWKYLRTDTDTGLSYFAVWVLSFVPWLYLCSPAYRSGVGWSTHLFASMLLPPVVLLTVRGVRQWLLETSAHREHLRPYRRQVSLLLLFLTLTLAGIYLLSIRETFSWTTVPFGNTPLMQSIGELAAPHFGYWIHRYGSVFLTGSLGLSLMPMFRWGRLGRPLSVALGVFCGCVFYRHQMAAVCGETLATGVFGCAVVSILLTFLHLAWKLSASETVDTRIEQVDPSERPVINSTLNVSRLDVLTGIAMLVWGVFWLALAREAKRYDFFIGVPLAYFTATLIRDVAVRVCRTLRDSKWTTPALQEKLSRLFVNETSVATVLFISVLVWGPIEGGHIFRSHAAAAHMRHATPGTGELAEAYAWMKAHLPENAVVAAEWSYGTQLNVLGRVRTITGPDHYLPSWIALYHQHVEHAKNEQEVLEFLFSHEATHLMMTVEKQPENTLLRSGTLSGVFVERYPESDFASAAVKVWELRYPTGLEKRPEYLRTNQMEDTHDPQPDHRH